MLPALKNICPSLLSEFDFKKTYSEEKFEQNFATYIAVATLSNF